MATETARSLRSQLTTLVLVSVVPVLIFAVVVAALFERHERAAFDRGHRDTARALMMGVDRELFASIAVLRGLATSEHLDGGDLAAFYEQSRRVLKGHTEWETINLFDRSGQQIVSLSLPFGAPLPASGDLPVIRRTLDTGEPAVSDLFIGPVSNAAIIGITVPVVRGGVLKYVLGASLDVGSLSRLLSESKLPPGWEATIFDRQGIILARTRGIDRWLRQPAAASLVDASRRSEEGIVPGVTVDGVATHGAYARSRLYGWTVALTVPTAIMEVHSITLAGVIAAGLALLLLAVGLATVSVRRIAGAIGSLSVSARALGRGEPVTAVAPSSISEVDDVARQMAEAARERAGAIAARLVTEEALRREAAIVESSEDAIIGTTVTGAITTWNRGATKVYGYSSEEVVGRSISLLAPSDCPDEVPALLERLTRGEVLERFETVRVCRDGTPIDVSVMLSPVRDVAGAIIGASSIDRDVTARKRAELTARAFAEVGRELTATLDIDETARKIVSAVLELLKGRRAALFQLEPASGTLVCVVAAGEGDPASWQGQRLVAGEGVVGRAIVDGKPFWTSDLLVDPSVALSPWVRARAHEAGYAAVAAVPLKLQGEVVGALSVGDAAGRAFTPEELGLLAAFADQAALALQNARLHSESNRRGVEAEALASIGRSISESLDVKEVAQRIANSVRRLFRAENAAVFRLEPGSEDLVTVAACGDVGATDPDSVMFPGGTGVVGLAVRTRQAVSTADLLTDPRVTLEPAARARIELGPYRAVLAAPLIVTDRVTGALGIGARAERVFTQDEIRLAEAFADQAATALENARLYQATQQAYEDLKRTQAQLVQAQKMESVGLLAGGIAHDFNNLLTVIAGRAELAIQRLEPTGQASEDLEAIGEATRRASALVRQLLAVGRRQMLQVQVLDLRTVVDDVERLLHRTIGEDITIVVTADPDLGRVTADPTQIEQVLMNLVINARDAMPQGGRLGIQIENLELDAAYARTHVDIPPGPYVTLSVSDTGAGMDPDTQARIFDPFFTTKEPGKGTGLGLATVYGIVKQSEGHVSVHSEPGRGTTFTVYLPRVGMPLAPPRAVSTNGALARGSETILLVEDEEGVRDLVREVLEASGYHVLVAGHPAAALAIAERRDEPIDLVLTDVVMPDMNGPELADRLTAVRPDLRILYMSGYADNAIVQRAVLDTGRPLLQKPFTPDVLVRQVQEGLQMALRASRA